MRFFRAGFSNRISTGILVLLMGLFVPFTQGDALSLARHTYLSSAVGLYSADPKRKMASGLNLSFDFGYQFSRYFALQGGVGWLNHGKYYKLYRAEGVVSLPKVGNTVMSFIAGFGQMRFIKKHQFVDVGLGTHYYIAPRISLDLYFRVYRQHSPIRRDLSLGTGLTWYFGSDEGDNLSFDDKQQRATLPRLLMARKVPQQTRMWQRAIEGLPHCSFANEASYPLCINLNKTRAYLYLNIPADNSAHLNEASMKVLRRFVALYQQYAGGNMDIDSSGGIASLDAQHHIQRFKQTLVNHYGMVASKIQIGVFMPQLFQKQRDSLVRLPQLSASFAIILPETVS